MDQYPQQPPQYPQQPPPNSQYYPQGYPQQPGYPPPAQYPQQPMYGGPPSMPPAPPKKKRRGIGIGVLLVFAVVVCGAIASASHSSNEGTAVTTVSTQSISTPTAATPPQHFKVGQVVKVGDAFEVTVNSVKTSAGDAVSQPKTGNQYLLVDVSIKNISTKPQSVSSLIQWKLRDTTGLEYTETITDLGTAPDGDIAIGTPIRGVFVYEVPTATKSFSLAFSPDLFDAGQTIWDISL